MGGVSMVNTASAYDIGSGTYRWDTVYCEHMKAQSINSDFLWKKVAAVNLTINTDYFSLTGITATASQYRICGHLVFYTSTLSLLFLSPDMTITSNSFIRMYKYANWGGMTSAANYAYQNSPGLFFLSSYTYTSIDFSHTIYYQSTTTIIEEFFALNSNSTISSLLFAGTAKTTATITGFYFEGKFAPGSRVWLYKAE
jgi:hypothetical protein